MELGDLPFAQICLSSCHHRLTYPKGAEVSLIAMASPGYRYLKWPKLVETVQSQLIVRIPATGPSITVIMDSNKENNCPLYPQLAVKINS